MKSLLLCFLSVLTFGACGVEFREGTNAKKVVTNKPDEVDVGLNCESIKVMSADIVKTGPYYNVYVNVINVDPLMARGFYLHYLPRRMPIAGFVTQSSSPTLVKAHGKTKALVARSKSKLTLDDISKKDFSFETCPALAPQDLLFTAIPGRSYTFQRSTNLVQWEDLNSVTVDSEQTIWRSGAEMLASPENKVREFYRVKATAIDIADAAREKARLEQSGIDLRESFSKP